MTLIFVYGTLKRNYRNYHYLANSLFVEETCTEGMFAMIDMGNFPAVLKQTGSSCIYGEAFEVDSDTLNILDEFEGPWFKREVVRLKCGCNAWMYFLSPDVEQGKYSVVDPAVWVE